jgi:ribosomal protein L37E
LYQCRYRCRFGTPSQGKRYRVPYVWICIPGNADESFDATRVTKMAECRRCGLEDAWIGVLGYKFDGSIQTIIRKTSLRRAELSKDIGPSRASTRII